MCTLAKTFSDLISNQIDNPSFYQSVVNMTMDHPYLYVGYQELFYLLESRNCSYDNRELLRHTCDTLTPFLELDFSDEQFRKYFFKENVEAAIFFAEKMEAFTLGDKYKKNKLILTLRSFLNEDCESQIYHNSGDYLRLVETIDSSFAIKELASFPTAWFLNMSRQLQVVLHSKTNAIILRHLPENKGETYIQVDGLHESVRTAEADQFLSIVDAVEYFAQKENAGLGRVAIVRLRPHGMVYRHYDSEKHLIGRERYHWVIDCGPGNIMEVGTDKVEAKPGELWFFENHVMHQSFNKSNQWRTHVIFDMKSFNEK